MNKANQGANTNTIQIFLDILILAISYAGSIFINRDYLNEEQIINTFVLICVFAMIYVLSNKEEMLYDVTLFYYLDRIHRKVTKSFLMATVAMAALIYIVDIDLSRRVVLIFLIIAYILLWINIYLFRSVYDKVKTRFIPRTIFIGRIEEFEKFQTYMKKTSICIDEVGYVSLSKEECTGDFLGSIEDLEDIIKEYHIDQVYIMQKKEEALPMVQKYIDLCIDMGVTVRLIINFYKRRKANTYVSSVGTYPIVTYHMVSLNNYQQVLKRVMDILGGLAGAIISSPIMLVTAIAIKIDSPGPVLFKQTRVGRNGREFIIYKFRSMYIDAEERKAALMEKNEVAGGVMFKIKDDPRITKVGKIIRKLSIDELPQFFNVIEGTMSLVGTRPPTLDEVAKYERNQWRRISIKPGITGMWQVSGRSNVQSFEEIVEMDTDYIDNWDIFLDIKIIFKTVLVLLKHDDAY